MMIVLTSDEIWQIMVGDLNICGETGMNQDLAV